MSITVYSKPRCPQCDATYRALDKQGVSYEKIDVTQDAESLAFIKGLGYQQAPASWPARITGPASAPTASRLSPPQLPPWRCRPESRRQVPAARPGLSRIWAGTRPGRTPRWA